jgi:glycosyltransferase involved in cell wall biosynthesis
MTNRNPAPSISVVIATYQSERTIGQCLASVRNQRYPQDRIRIIVADGGSTDQTHNLVQKYGGEIIPIPPEQQSAEYNKGVAVRAATGDLLLMIDHDNVLPHPEWLKNMIRPFNDNKDMVAVQPLRYGYEPTLSLLDRYCALFGASDPVVYYLGKCDHLPWFKTDHIRFGQATDQRTYYLVKMDPDRIPTLGANGCLVRRDLLFAHSQIKSDTFFHIDVHVDLISKGWNTYAFTKDTLLHLTSYRQLRSFLWRRKLFVEQFYLATNVQRRYLMFRGKQDLPRLIFFIVAASTFVWPTIEALRGYYNIRDRAWFLHPLIAFSLLVIYSYTMSKAWLQTKFTQWISA